MWNQSSARRKIGSGSVNCQRSLSLVTTEQWWSQRLAEPSLSPGSAIPVASRPQLGSLALFLGSSLSGLSPVILHLDHLMFLRFCFFHPAFKLSSAREFVWVTYSDNTRGQKCLICFHLSCWFWGFFPPFFSDTWV